MVNKKYKDIYLNTDDKEIQEKLNKVISILEEKHFVTYDDLENCEIDLHNYKEYEAIVEALSREGIEVLTREEDFIGEEEEQHFEPEESRIKLSEADREDFVYEMPDDFSDGGRDYDPMKMYMQEIGRVDLLKNKKEEIIIAKQIEGFHFNAISSIVSCPFTIRQIFSLADELINNPKKGRLEDFVDGVYTDEDLADIIKRSNSVIYSSLLEDPKYQFLKDYIETETVDTEDNDNLSELASESDLPSYLNELKEAEDIEEKPLILGIKNTGNLDYTKIDSDQDKLDALNMLLSLRPLALSYINKTTESNFNKIVNTEAFKKEGEAIRNKMLRIRFATATVDRLAQTLISEMNIVNEIIKDIEEIYLNSVGKYYLYRLKETLSQNLLNLKWIEKEIQDLKDPKLLKNKSKIIDLQKELIKRQAYLGVDLNEFLKTTKHLVFNQTASRKAKEKMVRANLRLVVSIASKFQNNNLPLSDRTQEGNCGLLKAIDKFNYRRGFKFSTYATWWIRQSVLRALADDSRIIRLPVHVIEDLNRMKKILLEQEQKGSSISEPKLAELSEVSIKKMRSYEYVSKDPVSIDYTVDSPLDDDTTSVGDFIEDDVSLTPEQSIEKERLAHYILEPLAEELSEREMEVIKMRFGIGYEREMSLDEIGSHFEVTRERIRQIEAKCLKKLRHSEKMIELREFSDGKENKRKKVENNEAKAKRKETLIRIRTMEEVLEQRKYHWDDL